MSMRYKGGIISATPPTTSSTSASGAWTLQQQMQAQAAGNWPYGGPFNYIEDVFSTYLYTGNSAGGSTTTVTNNIDLSTKGGLVWIKQRDTGTFDTFGHVLTDSARGITKVLQSNNTSAQQTITDTIASFDTTGFTAGFSGYTNNLNDTYASWTFREQPKFFDVVTYTGNGTSQNIAHNLGSTPGCIIVKSSSNALEWYVWHRSLTSSTSSYIFLNRTDAATTSTAVWNNTAPTSTQFSVGATSATNGNGNTYVAYIFAHNAGGFGTSNTDNVISCGSYVGNGSTTGPVVTLGYEPQWVLVKRITDGIEDWEIYDNMRGIVPAGADQILYPNQSTSEQSATRIQISATGFSPDGTAGSVNASGKTYIYIAIRRGPMKVPTSATTVFNPAYAWDTSSSIMGYLGQPTDAFWLGYLSGNAVSVNTRTRLVGGNRLTTSSTDAEVVDATTTYWDSQLGFQTGGSLTTSLITWNFRRAPSFMDVVCYTGNLTVTAHTHNLGIAPQLILLFQRSPAANSFARLANPALLGSDKWLYVNQTDAVQTSTNIWANTAPTASTFTVGASSASNISGTTYIAYLFATCAGVSKVGSYTGTGALQTVNCGFTSGARFVFIKRTDSTGGWFTYDSVRGITASDDPYLLLNSSAAQVTNTNYVDTDSTGFKVTAAAPAELNASGGTYIFLAIA